MKEIILTKGKVALVDDEDYVWVSQWHWYFDHNGYATRCERWDGKKHSLRLHRELLRVGPHKLVDHINGNRLDNRRVNLRVASPTVNSRNCLLSVRNKTGHKGVYWIKRVNMYEAYIVIAHKRKYLGIYRRLEDAIVARKEGEIKYWGYTTEDLRNPAYGT